ncbi:Cuticle Protein Tweedle [Hyalella azteca]|nr:Cuticle Protein Tweedle [Hyalella azteca]
MYQSPHHKRPKTHIRIFDNPNRDYNYVFVRSPEVRFREQVIVGPPKQQSLIYLLARGNQVVPREVVQLPAQNERPEVYYINYNDPQEDLELPGGINLQTALAQESIVGEFVGGNGGRYGTDSSLFARVEDIQQIQGPETVSIDVHSDTTATGIGAADSSGLDSYRQPAEAVGKSLDSVASGTSTDESDAEATSGGLSSSASSDASLDSDDDASEASASSHGADSESSASSSSAAATFLGDLRSTGSVKSSSNNVETAATDSQSSAASSFTASSSSSSVAADSESSVDTDSESSASSSSATATFLGELRSAGSVKSSSNNVETAATDSQSSAGSSFTASSSSSSVAADSESSVDGFTQDSFASVSGDAQSSTSSVGGGIAVSLDGAGSAALGTSSLSSSAVSSSGGVIDIGAPVLGSDTLEVVQVNTVDDATDAQHFGSAGVVSDPLTDFITSIGSDASAASSSAGASQSIAENIESLSLGKSFTEEENSESTQEGSSVSQSSSGGEDSSSAAGLSSSDVHSGSPDDSQDDSVSTQDGPALGADVIVKHVPKRVSKFGSN